MDNAARDDGGGISMVHRCGLKNLLMVKVRALEILKLRTTRKKRAKDRPTTIVVLWEEQMNNPTVRVRPKLVFHSMVPYCSTIVSSHTLFWDTY